MRAETPYSRIEALVIDDMATQQTTLRGQLGMLGIAKIEAAGSAEDALRHIRSRPYGLILCDYNLNHKTDGQQLFEYLREQHLLAPDCLFFMVTAESSYNSVASASEHLPDAYLIKPVTAGDIEDRLKAQLEKRQALLEINRQLGRKDLVAALKACDTLLAKKDRWFMHGLQLKGQIELDLGQPDEARQVYLQALELRPGLTWAQIGLARSYKAAGRFADAKRLAQDLLQTREGEKNLAAFDLLAQSMEAMGDVGPAMDVLKQAAQVVPSAKRLRIVAESAYRNNDLATAKAALTKAIKTSQLAITAQPLDHLLLAQTLVDLGESREALQCLAERPEAAKHTVKSPELDTVALAIRAQAHAALGETDTAQKEAQQALRSFHQTKADFQTIAVARAALVAGETEQGLKLIRSAVSADHENARIQQLATKALEDTGHADQFELVVGAATKGLKTRLYEAKRLLRDGALDDALTAIEQELAEFPENTTVLLECAQMNCMYLRLKKQLDERRVDQVRDYLTRLEKLLPGHERVAQMRRYLRETLAALSGQASFQISNKQKSA